MGASINLNHWADGAWADASWVPESWGEGGETPVVQAFSGGWERIQYRVRTPKDVEEGRRRLGMLPPEEEAKVEQAVSQAVQAAVELSQAKPETQAATDALLAQQRAEELFLRVYLAVYPQLLQSQIEEAFRLETARLAEEAFVILLLL